MAEENKPTEAQKAKNYFYTETQSNEAYRDDITKLIRDTRVPINDEKPDVRAYASSIVMGAKKVVAKHFGDEKDPEWTPTDADILAILDTYTNPVKDGTIRSPIQDEIVNAYTSRSTNRVISRATLRASPYGDGKEYATSVASDITPRGFTNGLENLVATAPDAQSLQRKVPIVLSDYLRKQQEAYARTGSYLKPVEKAA